MVRARSARNRFKTQRGRQRDRFASCFDAHGNRTESAAVEQTIYVHDQGQVVLQFDKSGSGNLAAGDLSHRYLWSPGVVDQLLTDEHVNDLFDAEENETLWALTDRLGSITDMVDTNATLRLHRAFDSFGNIVEEMHYDEIGVEVTPEYDGYLDVAFAYTGRFLDSATGLQNNLNRWYDASVGRWLSEDPIGFEGGDGNLYRYVGNGPVNGTDPSGLAYSPVPRPRPGIELPGPGDIPTPMPEIDDVLLDIICDQLFPDFEPTHPPYIVPPEENKYDPIPLPGFPMPPEEPKDK